MKVALLTIPVFLVSLAMAFGFFRATQTFEKKSVQVIKIQKFKNTLNLAKRHIEEPEVVETQKVHRFKPVKKEVVKKKAIKPRTPKKVFAFVSPSKKIERKPKKKLAKKTNSRFFGQYQIINKELISHYGFKVSADKYKKFSLTAYYQNFSFGGNSLEAHLNLLATQYPTNAGTKIASKENNNGPQTDTILATADQLKDRVKIAQSSINKKDDDLVFFDYSTTKPTKLISNNVMNAIQREIGEPKKINTDRVFLAQNTAPQDHAGPSEEMLDFIKKADGVSGRSPSNGNNNLSINIHAIDVDVIKQKYSKLENVEFAPLYDPNEIYNPNEQGVIEFRKKINSKVAQIAGSMLSSDKVKTNIVIKGDKENKAKDYFVPMFDMYALGELLDQKEIVGQGGYLVVELQHNIKAVDIDQIYESKLYFDANFAVVENYDDSKYVMFVGVNPGNVLVNYDVSTDNRVFEIIPTVESEITFTSPTVLKQKTKVVSLMENYPMGRSAADLDILESEFKLFLQNAKAQKESINQFQYNLPNRLSGERSYFELTHLSDSVFVSGTGSKFEIPSSDFIENIFYEYSLKTLQESCMIQINLDKEIKDIKYESVANNSQVVFEPLFLDKDGKRGRDFVPGSEKLFLLGDKQGYVNIMFEYTDDSVDIVQSYCSKSTYLLEHL